MDDVVLLGAFAVFAAMTLLQLAMLFHCGTFGFKRDEVVVIVLAVVLSISVQVGCVYAMKWAGGQKDLQRNAEYDSIRQSGYRAGRDGVPVNANPYKAGSNNCLVWSEGWQQGFIDAKKAKGE